MNLHNATWIEGNSIWIWIEIIQIFILNSNTLNEVHSNWIELNWFQIKLSLDSISKLKSIQMSIIFFFFQFNMVIIPIEIGWNGSNLTQFNTNWLNSNWIKLN
jgi:hypothetical protein